MIEQFAGSRLHILDWIEGRSGDFRASLRDMLKPWPIEPIEGRWQPKSFSDAAEADLARPPAALLSPGIGGDLGRWWLARPGPQSRTPNWDLAIAARFPSGEGLVLVEAKAHAAELQAEARGKPLPGKPSTDSLANHAQIGQAIAEARDGLGGPAAGVKLDRDHCYQFSNRVAFAWKLASLGIPTALLYLGFTEDSCISHGYFQDEACWLALLQKETEAVLPWTFWEREIATSAAPFWLLSRAKPCARPSPPLEIRRGWIQGQRGNDVTSNEGFVVTPDGRKSDAEFWDGMSGKDTLPANKNPP
jgi:hypothetical protein